MILYLLGKYRGVGLPDHTVNHIRNSQGVFQMAALFVFPAMGESSDGSAAFPALDIAVLLYYSRYKGQLVAFHRGLICIPL